MPAVFKVLNWVLSGERGLFSRRLQLTEYYNEIFLEDENEYGARMRTYTCVIPFPAR